ncbi:endonuclease/exonuclease/phosphatase family protein [Algibacter miyuki]|uniref:Endonuclease/exonuclease/phosphatase family protein n=1 Tax=Algibacter miyuki TaxID=1306933 RepID=A0ABV5GV12_9FLAO|nr:endonuclease/exonuclease/phosphatase family protein [Algibacter miyuki]MDN3664801.1 endonuclease/exonuclease/phosphatase family protein [Algibacter miyuki]
MVGSKRVPFKIIINVLQQLAFIVNVLLVLALLLLHFVIKDCTFRFAIWFYMLPLPVIILIILAASVFLGKKRKYNLIVAGLLTVFWFFTSFSISFTEPVEPTDIEVVFWNASRDDGLQEAFIENGGIPDVMVLSESKNNNFEKLKAKYPDYYFYSNKELVVLFSKQPIHIVKEEVSRFGSTIITFNTYGVNFYSVDMQGSLDVPKAWEFKFESSIIKNTQNTVVLGDFNAPYESIFLKGFKKNYTHFFDKKGNGFRETWPWSLPLLSIDHIWVSKDLRIVNSEKIHSKNSDHSMIKTVIRK